MNKAEFLTDLKLLDISEGTQTRLFELEVPFRVPIVCNKTLPKRNALAFIGPPNAGKTLLADSIVKSFVYFGNLQKIS